MITIDRVIYAGIIMEELHLVSFILLFHDLLPMTRVIWLSFNSDIGPLERLCLWIIML